MSGGTLVEGLRLVEFLSKQPEPLTMREILAETALTRATAFRVVAQLVEEGWLNASGSPRRLSLALRASSVGLRSLGHDPVRHVVMPNLIGLATEAHLPAFFSRVEEGLTWWLDVVEVVGGRIIHTPEGSTAPAAATASGRAIMSSWDEGAILAAIAGGVERLTEYTRTTPSEILPEIDEARGRGYSIVRDEVRVGLTSMAAAIRDGSGTAVAAIGLSEIDPADEERTSRLPEALMRWARRSSAELGFRSVWGIG